MNGLGIDYAAVMRNGMGLVPDFNQVEAIRAQTEAQKAVAAKAAHDMQVALRNHQREEDFMYEATEVFRNPTAKNIASLQARYPDHYKAIQSGWDTLGEEQRQNELTELGSIYTRIRANQPERAIEILERRITADRKAGAVDPNDSWALEEIRSGDPERIANVGGALTILMSTAVGADKFGSTFGSVREEERQQDEHGAKVRKGVADATTAEAEAVNAADYYAARADHEFRKADIAASNAAWQDRKNASEVASRNARTAATRGREGRAASGVPMVRRKPATRSDYVQFAEDRQGRKIGFNRKTKRWERVQ